MFRKFHIASSSLAAALATIAAVAACGSANDDPSAPKGTTPPLTGTTDALPTETSPPSVYVAKVKNILVGLPPTDEEVKAVEADPTKLASLIDGWTALPQYQTKMLRFFQLAFQQTQVDEIDFTDQTFPQKTSINRATTPLLVQNLTESFARTVYALVSAGHPITEAMTTKTFMMTPALMEQYAFFDAWQVDDAGKVTDRFKVAHPGVPVVITATAIPFADSVNPSSGNFMKFTYAGLADLAAKNPGCYADPVTYTATPGASLQRYLQGSLDGIGKCPNTAGVAAGPLADTDYTDWRMVTIRAPKAGESTTNFYDLPTLRGAKELVLDIPRVGFFSTPAFFANWQTNTSNEMRVTMNQALIVGLGAAVDGSDATHPASTPGLDTTHAAAPQCVACHQTLDPTRSIFAASFSWNYHVQTEKAFSSQPGMFAFQGVTKPVASLDDFGATLASHPLFGQAWAQKLCYYANSRKCDAGDPEFQRVLDVFTKSGFMWSTLVRELLSSPITTNATATVTLSDEGEVIAVSRRDHLCAALNARLGFSDVCGLDQAAPPKGKLAQSLASVAQIVPGLPSDGYGRGAIAPVLPNAPSLFYRAGTENICEAVSQLVVDPVAPTPGAKVWASASPDAAITELVQLLMALTPSDPRSAPSIAALQKHFSSAVAGGATPTDALRSTFVVACLAPSSISIGL